MTFCNIRRLLKNGSVSEADALMSVTNPEDLPLCQIVGVLAATALFSDVLESRAEFKSSSLAVLESSGCDMVDLLKELEGIENV